MNVSAPFIVQVPPFRAALLEALKHCTYVFCNESEAEEFANAMEWKDLVSYLAVCAAWPTSLPMPNAALEA